VLVEDHRTGVPVGCQLVLACDVWEHAYTLDYGMRKDAGVAAWFENVSWEYAEGLLALASGR
jgi:Fe-Mn family superoxide dismutase